MRSLEVQSKNGHRHRWGTDSNKSACDNRALFRFIMATVNVVETGEITASYDSNTSSSIELRDACRKIVRKMFRK